VSEINKYLEFSKNNPFGTQAKMLYHVDRVSEYVKTGDTFPIFMEVNLTDVCNLKCAWCISNNRLEKEKPNVSLDFERLKLFVKDFASNGGKALTWSGGGEPTLYKYFREITEYALECGLELGLMTHGGFNKNLVPLIGNSFKWSRMSLDTLDAVKYKAWKGLDLTTRIKENVAELKDYPCKVGINVNINSDMPVSDIRELIEYCYDNVDYIQFRPILPRYFKNETIEINNAVWEYLEQYKTDPKINLSLDKFYDLKSEQAFPFKSCEGHFFSPILDAGGDIKICMYHPNRNEFSFGNINNKTFLEIWNGEQRQKAIEFVRKLDYSKNCQMCCKLCELNKFVDFIKNPNQGMDINFL
jgi:radical SAM protein with 4Fe4S-binding SPASM domain